MIEMGSFQIYLNKIYDCNKENYPKDSGCKNDSIFKISNNIREQVK
jgi:hypothetical protein